MNFFETLERIQRMHALIKSEHTGTPDEFARRLGICRKTLYNMIDELKSYNAPIRYSKKKESFYYLKEFELELHCRFLIIEDEKTLKNINGGYSFF
jgi:predicted DNA-binding transcriptional regulator YafY